MAASTPIHPIFRDTPPAEASLWRYLSFARLASLLHSSHLHFTRVDLFDDHFEGAWPKSDLEFWLSKSFPLAVYFTEQHRSRVAASCWVESAHESAAMWRLYAPGEEGVAIRTTFGKLQSLMSEADAKACAPESAVWVAGAGRVKYIDHSVKGLIEGLEMGEPIPNALMPFMLKNVSYEQEKEVRALIVAGRGYEIGREGLKLKLNVNEFVDEIVTNPFCQSWFTEAVAGLVERYGLAGKLRQSSLSRSTFYKDEFYKDLMKKSAARQDASE